MLSSSRHATAPAKAPKRTERVGPQILHFTSTAMGSAYVDNSAKGFSSVSAWRSRVACGAASSAFCAALPLSFAVETGFGALFTV